MGLMLIKELMDSVDFESDHTGTTLTMVKKRKKMNKVTQIEVVGDVLVIATEGYLNKDLGEDIQNAAQEHIENGIKKVLINLERSNIVNSIGASILIELIEELQRGMDFCNLATIIEKTFKIMGLTKYCESYMNQAEALEKMA